MTEAVIQAPRLARVSEAAVALACSEDQIRKFMTDGTLPRIPLGKSGVRTSWAAIDAYVRQGEQKEQVA